jgi:hypothetical protein
VDDDVDLGNEIARGKAEVFGSDAEHVDEAFLEFAGRRGRFKYRDGALVVGNQTIGERSPDVNAHVIRHAPFHCEDGPEISISKSCPRFEIGGNSISAKSTERGGIVPAIDPIVTADCWYSRLRAVAPQSAVVTPFLSIGHCAKGASQRASRRKFICTDLSASGRLRQRFRPPALAWCLLEVYTL